MSIVAKSLFDLLSIPIVRALAKKILGRIILKHDICICVRGLKIYSNTIDRLLASLMWKFSSLEAFETELLRKAIRPGMIVADIGANIGYYTLLMGQLVGPKGVVHAFEPDPNNFRLLVKNIAANNLPNIIPIQKAVSDRSGMIKLYICKEHRGDHRIFESDDNRPSIDVAQTSIDDYFENNPNLDLIKMDVQGAEQLVIKGFTKTIKSNEHIVIITEFSPDLLRKSGGDPEEFLKSLIIFGFTIQFIDEKNKQLKPIKKEELINLCSGDRYENICLARN